MWMHTMLNLLRLYFYSISYKTQIVGGVVHRIPITAGAVIEVSKCGVDYSTLSLVNIFSVNKVVVSSMCNY